MKTKTDPSKQSTESKANARHVARQPSSKGVSFEPSKAEPLIYADKRPEVIAQRKWQTLADSSPQVTALQRRQEAVDDSPHMVAQRTSQAGNGVVQRAGTKPNTPSKDGKYRIKLSSDREQFTYENRGALGLDAVLPQHYRIFSYGHNGGLVYYVRLAKNGPKVELKNPIPVPSGNKKLLMIDTVGYEEPEEEEEQVEESEKLFIDIKIGHYTKSGQQFKLEGANVFMRRLKQLEHDLKDISRTSDVEGYDIDSANLKAFTTAHKRAMKKQEPNLRLAMRALWTPLDNIRKAMASAPVTFVGSSVFIVLNLTNPDNSAVKLIDPDHPIVLDKPDTIEDLGTVPKDVMTSEKMSGERSWNAYVKKWKWNFGSGMVNFMKWYKARYNEIPSA